MKKVIILVLAIVVIVAGVLGYGFYGGYKTKAFAKESEKILDASESKWKVDKILEPEGVGEDMTKVKSYYTTLKEDSTSALSTLNNLRGTARTKDLEKDLTRFYELGKKAGENGLILIDWIEKMQDVSAKMSPTISASGTEQAIAQYNQFKASVDESIKTLKAVETTPSIEEFNQDFLSALEEMSGLLEQMLAYLKNNQLDKIEAMTSQFDQIMKKFSGLQMPATDKIKEDVLTKSEEEEMTKIAERARTNLSELKKVVFAF